MVGYSLCIYVCVWHLYVVGQTSPREGTSGSARAQACRRVAGHAGGLVRRRRREGGIAGVRDGAREVRAPARCGVAPGSDRGAASSRRRRRGPGAHDVQLDVRQALHQPVRQRSLQHPLKTRPRRDGAAPGASRAATGRPPRGPSRGPSPRRARRRRPGRPRRRAPPGGRGCGRTAGATTRASRRRPRRARRGSPASARRPTDRPQRGRAAVDEDEHAVGDERQLAAGRGALQLALDPLRHEAQGELAEGGQVGLGEELLERDRRPARAGRRCRASSAGEGRAGSCRRARSRRRRGARRRAGAR